MSDFIRILRPGTIPNYNGRRIDVFVKVEFRDGKLSITGVEGPKANGDAESCGQIDGHYRHRNPADDDSRYGDALLDENDINFAPEWTPVQWLDLLDVWSRWHLNNMSPMCEHQRAVGWGDEAKREVKIFHWQLTGDATSARRKLKAASLDALAEGESVKWDEATISLMARPYWVTTTTDEPPNDLYEPKREGAVETKDLGWLRPNEHPDGILTKPCPVCGFKYGSAWLDETVPDAVIAFLQSLPEADKTPAWV